MGRLRRQQCRYIFRSGLQRQPDHVGLQPAYSDLVSKLAEVNSKLTLVDDTVIFKAGQTTESESLVVKVEGELPEFINLVSPDLMVDDYYGGSQPSSLIHTFGGLGAQLTRIIHDDVSVWQATEEQSTSVVQFEFGRNLPNVIPEEDIVLTYSLATDINSRNFHSLYQAVVEGAGEESVGYSWSGDIYSEAGYNANLTTSGYKPAYSDLVSKLGDINSKLTLVDDTVIFKAGQTTESEGLVVKVEGELPEFISLVSPDLLRSIC